MTTFCSRRVALSLVPGDRSKPGLRSERRQERTLPTVELVQRRVQLGKIKRKILSYTSETFEAGPEPYSASDLLKNYRCAQNFKND